MADIKVLEETEISMSETKHELAKIKKRDKELNYRGNKTEEYLNMFETLDDKKTKELKEKIEALNIPRFKPSHMAKIIDLLPKSEKDIKMILQGHTISISAENAKKIVDTVKSYQ